MFADVTILVSHASFTVAELQRERGAIVAVIVMFECGGADASAGALRENVCLVGTSVSC